MSKFERDGQLIEKTNIPARPERIDDIVEVDFESSHLPKYFSSQTWHHLLETGNTFQCNKSAIRITKILFLLFS